MREAKIIKSKDKMSDPNYEPPLQPGRGIWSESVENPGLTLSLVAIPAGARNQRHFHTFCDAGMHILKGRLKMVFGPDHEMEEAIAEPGDFAFVPAGVIHGLMNLSDTEPAELISCYSVGHRKDAGTVFIEPRWDKKK
jgi:uncharacterized RmlC-like cupin family protein